MFIILYASAFSVWIWGSYFFPLIIFDFHYFEKFGDGMTEKANFRVGESVYFLHQISETRDRHFSNNSSSGSGDLKIDDPSIGSASSANQVFFLFQAVDDSGAGADMKVHLFAEGAEGDSGIGGDYAQGAQLLGGNIMAFHQLSGEALADALDGSDGVDYSSDLIAPSDISGRFASHKYYFVSK